MAYIRIAGAAANPAPAALRQTAKAGVSRFDAVRFQLAQKAAAASKLPPMAQPSPSRVSAIQTGLKQQLEGTGARSPGEFFQPAMKSVRVELDKLTQATGNVSPQSAPSAWQDRLKSLEQQFQQSGDLIQRIPDMDPKSLLSVQVQLYQLSENIGLMSKVVEQASSGVKTVMQTQV
jgi:hypothetical protein